MVTVWLTSKKHASPETFFDNAGHVLSETAVKGCVKKFNKIQTVEIATKLKEAWKYRKIPKISPSIYKLLQI